jgi:branched-chain amino acid transport system substrate-binding protein
LGTSDVNNYAAQTYDHINLVALALAHGKFTAAQGSRQRPEGYESARGGSGEFQEGIKLIKEGKKINYQGASGAVDFDDKGDILSRPFSYYQVKNGKNVVIGRMK